MGQLSSLGGGSGIRMSHVIKDSDRKRVRTRLVDFLCQADLLLRGDLDLFNTGNCHNSSSYGVLKHAVLDISPL